VLLSVALLGIAPLAHADGLDDQKKDKQDQIAQTKTNIAKNQDAVDKAAAAVATSKNQLATAQADLAAKQQIVQAAKAQDQALAADLAVAQQVLADRQAELVTAQAAVVQGEANLAAQRDTIGLIAQETAQQNTTLLSLSMLLSGDFDTAKINNQAQWATTLFTASESAMEQLRSLQTQLVLAQTAAQQAQDAAAAAEADVQAKKDASAAHLAVTQQAQADAASAAQNVASKVAANQKAQADAQAALDQEEANLKQEQADLADIEAKIQAEIEAQKNQGTPDQQPPSSGTFFQRPVNGPVTSAYGWRIHPITGSRQFHSGVDFGVACGTPILAAADGVISQASWYGGYGNYTGINLGQIGGDYWSVGYGHQSKILVSVGQHVSRGQVIGLVGTTGMSTGCHLHFNVFKNGSTVNGLPLVS